MTDFEVADTIIRPLHLTCAAEVMNYDWSPDFCKTYIKEIESRIKAFPEYRPIDPTKFTEEEMRVLGFRKASPNRKDLLIPLWLFKFLVDEIPGVWIDGSEGIFILAEGQNDHRGGLLPFGVFPKEE